MSCCTTDPEAAEDLDGSSYNPNPTMGDSMPTVNAEDEGHFGHVVMSPSPRSHAVFSQFHFEGAHAPDGEAERSQQSSQNDGQLSALPQRQTRISDDSGLSRSPRDRKSWQTATSQGVGKNPSYESEKPRKSVPFSDTVERISSSAPKLKKTMKTGDFADNWASDESEDLQERHRQEGWGGFRIFCSVILETNFRGTETNIFDSLMGFVILFNVFVMIMETDASAESLDCPRNSDCAPAWIVYTNHTLLGIYTAEVVMRFNLLRRAFFFSGVWVNWNILDLFIVVTGIVSSAFEGDRNLKKFSMLRMFRVLRIIRMAKILRRFPTLSMMIHGFAGAMQSMFIGLVLILLLLTIWSILAVELVHPQNMDLEHVDGEWCQVAFSSVLNSTLFFFQTLVAGDSWGACTIPIIQYKPATFILFSLAMVSVNVGLMNLVLASIVDKAAEAREGTKAEQALQRKRQAEEHLEWWYGLMKDVDADGNGLITEDELIMAYNNHQEVRKLLETLTMSKADLVNLFNSMVGPSGELDSADFIGALHKAQTQDPRMYLMLMRFQIQRLEFNVNAKIENTLKNIEDRLSPKKSPKSGLRDVQENSKVKKLVTDQEHYSSLPQHLDPSLDFEADSEVSSPSEHHFLPVKDSPPNLKHRSGAALGTTKVEAAPGFPSESRSHSSIRQCCSSVEQELLALRENIDTRCTTMLRDIRLAASTSRSPTASLSRGSSPSARSRVSGAARVQGSSQGSSLSFAALHSRAAPPAPEPLPAGDAAAQEPQPAIPDIYLWPSHFSSSITSWGTSGGIVGSVRRRARTASEVSGGEGGGGGGGARRSGSLGGSGPRAAGKQVLAPGETAASVALASPPSNASRPSGGSDQRIENHRGPSSSKMFEGPGTNGGALLLQQALGDIRDFPLSEDGLSRTEKDEVTRPECADSM